MSERASSRLIGQVLNDTYVITALIGRGGMGTVYEATHLRLGEKKFALKILHPGLADDSTTRKRFQREAEIAASIGHPNIVDVVDINTTAEDTPYLVMELLRGESLAERLIRRKHLPLEETAEIVRQVASALSAVHANHIVHRDIKPANIFLLEGPTTRVKVLDFGLSKMQMRVSVNTATQSIFGTIFYMSPEQASGKVQAIDHRSDIFSLGCVCYEMLTGSLPFPGDEPLAVVERIKTMTPVPPTCRMPGLAAEVDVVLGRAMAKDRGLRYQTVGSLARDLCRVATRNHSGPLQATVLPPDLDLTPRMSHSSRLSLGDVTLPPEGEIPPDFEATRPRKLASRESLEELFAAEAPEDTPTDPRGRPVDPVLLSRPKHAVQATGPVPLAARSTMRVSLPPKRWPKAKLLMLFVLSGMLGAAIIVQVLWPQIWGKLTRRRNDSASSGAAAVDRPKQASALLTLEVSPPAGMIFLDGIPQQGNVLRLSPLQPTHHVKVVAPGYHLWERDVPSHTTQTLRVSLDEVTVPPQTGEAKSPETRRQPRRNGRHGTRRPSTGKRPIPANDGPQDDSPVFEEP